MRKKNAVDEMTASNKTYLSFILAALMLLSANSYAYFVSTNYELYPEGFDSGKTDNLTSAEYSLEGKPGHQVSGEASSANYIISSGFFSDINIDMNLPGPVTMTGSSTLNDGNIRITWNASLDGESYIKKYRIYRSVAENSFTVCHDEIDNLEYTDSISLIYNVVYYYKVQAVDMAGNEQTSGNTVITGVSMSLTTSVKDLKTVSKKNGEINISWTPIPLINKYNIYRSSTYGDKGTVIAADYALGTSYTDTPSVSGMTDGVRYYYTVQAVVENVGEQLIGNIQTMGICDSSSPTDPILSSLTHPDEKETPQNTPSFSWIESMDPKSSIGGASGMSGYFYLLSRNSSENFSEGDARWVFTSGLSVNIKETEDGVWYLHLVSSDKAGNLSACVKKKIFIMTKGSIAGRVLCPGSSSGLANIRIDLLDGKTTIMTGKTDGSGRFVFSGVVFGTYRIRVFRPGFAPLYIESCRICAGENSINIDKVFEAPQVITDGLASYPNPARGSSVTFAYEVSKPSEVTIEVYNCIGEKITSISDYQVNTGFQETKWDISGVATGVYIYLIKLRQTEDGSIVKLPVKKMSVIKQ